MYRYSVRNERVEFSSPCGLPLAQLNGIDLSVDVFEREDCPDNKMSDVRIEVEKFLVSSVLSIVDACDHEWHNLNSWLTAGVRIYYKLFKLQLKGGMQFGVDLKNYITDIKEMIMS